jgi:pimeloyl-ACP methyl ester carboxylesterase
VGLLLPANDRGLSWLVVTSSCHGAERRLSCGYSILISVNSLVQTAPIATLHSMRCSLISFLIAVSFSIVLRADGLADNDPTAVRQVPPEGIEVPAEIRQELQGLLGRLHVRIMALRQRQDARLSALLADVEIFERAVQSALQHNEFFSEKEFDQARELLQEGMRRAETLSQDTEVPYWTTQTGLVVRGYRSKIDDSPQPYGLVIPAETQVAPRRLDVWFHGRGERMSEVGFIYDRMHRIGEYAPADTMVLHPYGRYSNAFKFGGEVDVLEALASTQQRYAVDPDRISVRGFSMGGAACWQFAVHYSDRWFAANPGAGFSETPEFLRFFQQETLAPTWYERKLWQLYDCDGYAINLAQCPTIAYSGELDIQKQAADLMSAALAKEQIDLVHIIGPETKHAIHADAKIEIERRMAELARLGRDRLPHSIRFRTYTLKYNRMHWISIDGLFEHWLPAKIDADLSGHALQISTENVAALTIDFPAGTFTDIRTPIAIRIDGNDVVAQRPVSDRSLRISLLKSPSGWQVGKMPPGVRKQHDLQGPIDDAFMDSFIFVRPSGASDNAVVDNWVTGELQHAIKHWRQQFRGEARVRSDLEISEADIANANLILFGTPSTNQVLAKIADKLPIDWNESVIKVGDREFDSGHHVPLMIYPNPLNPERYVVLNSGFTYREYAYLNNARQVPMLPDWAIVDVRTPPSSQFPGKVADANFFDENWQIK